MAKNSDGWDVGQTLVVCHAASTTKHVKMNNLVLLKKDLICRYIAQSKHCKLTQYLCQIKLKDNKALTYNHCQIGDLIN